NVQLSLRHTICRRRPVALTVTRNGRGDRRVFRAVPPRPLVFELPGLPDSPSGLPWRQTPANPNLFAHQPDSPWRACPSAYH
ncbi:MAG TPA: hypothetical protein VFD73_08770, partial [Gemmatimonadales bacterium]|nr:hypothetical protein [Gemmatimonadales bacterium]